MPCAQGTMVTILGFNPIQLNHLWHVVGGAGLGSLDPFNCDRFECICVFFVGRKLGQFAVVGRVCALLDNGSRGSSGGTRICQTDFWLFIAIRTDCEQIFLTGDPVTIAPQLRTSCAHLQVQPRAVGQFIVCRTTAGRRSIRSISFRRHRPFCSDGRMRCCICKVKLQNSQ